MFQFVLVSHVFMKGRYMSMSLRNRFLVSTLAAIAAIVLTAATPANASILISAEEVGSNVVITVSGSLASWSFVTEPFFGVGPASVNPDVMWSGSVGGLPATGYFDGTISGPADFSTATLSANSSSGDAFGFQSNAVLIALPQNYTFGTPINSTATYTNKSFADFGWTSSTNKVWTFSGTPSTVTLTAVPEPSTYAMALAGLACGGYSMFRRRKWA